MYKGPVTLSAICCKAPITIEHVAECSKSFLCSSLISKGVSKIKLDFRNTSKLNLKIMLQNMKKDLSHCESWLSDKKPFQVLSLSFSSVCCCGENQWVGFQMIITCFDEIAMVPFLSSMSQSCGATFQWRYLCTHSTYRSFT